MEPASEEHHISIINNSRPTARPWSYKYITTVVTTFHQMISVAAGAQFLQSNCTLMRELLRYVVIVNELFRHCGGLARPSSWWSIDLWFLQLNSCLVDHSPVSNHENYKLTRLMWPPYHFYQWFSCHFLSEFLWAEIINHKYSCRNHWYMIGLAICWNNLTGLHTMHSERYFS